MTKKLFVLFSVGIVYCAAIAWQAAASPRGLWVTRFDYKSATDVIQIVQNARSLGANQIYFQVRGNATVFYPSKIEPWAWELNNGSPETIGKDPGWNPMQVALDESKKQGLELHAWLNVFPGWRGAIPAPKGTNHPWVVHRSWFMIDHRGVLLRPSRSFYSFLSPGNPEVRSYLGSVFGELAQNYPRLDGIHMDYIRYPGRTEVGNFRDFSYDAASVNAFKKIYKKNPQYDLPEWQRFKCDQVNASIQAIRDAIRSVTTTIQLSATCFADISRATEEKGQDPREWLKKGLVDFVVPMAYERTSEGLTSRLEAWNQSFDDSFFGKMAIGLNVDFNNESECVRQLEYVQKQDYGGIVLFAYSSLFPQHKANRKAELIRSVWHEQLLRDLLQNSSPPLSQ
ncbi:MAG: family 10 glycosylhydrolase [Candidatus Omnitrophica bacterium]|nr:family 10 glycosylhydrolase [Candidatus Omnitrophota bacterium]